MKIKKGDQVLVTTGKDRGKTGKVIRVFPKEGRLMVEGIALRTRHIRPRRAGQKGQRVQTPGRIFASSAKAVCPRCTKATRIGYKYVEGKKLRICKKCMADIS